MGIGRACDAFLTMIRKELRSSTDVAQKVVNVTPDRKCVPSCGGAHAFSEGGPMLPRFNFIQFEKNKRTNKKTHHGSFHSSMLALVYQQGCAVMYGSSIRINAFIHQQTARRAGLRVHVA